MAINNHAQIIREKTLDYVSQKRLDLIKEREEKMKKDHKAAL